jgi:hypothetical protein
MTAPALPRELENELAYLEPVERSVLLHYLKTGDLTEAAAVAEIGLLEASRLLETTRVRQAMQAFYRAVGGEALVSVPWVLSMLRENVERAMQATPVLDRDGKPTGEYTYEGNVVNAACKLIGEHLGMYTKKTETTEKQVTVLVVEILEPVGVDLPLEIPLRLPPSTNGAPS